MKRKGRWLVVLCREMKTHGKYGYKLVRKSCLSCCHVLVKKRKPVKPVDTGGR